MITSTDGIPRSHDEAMSHPHPKWQASVDKEKNKFETHNTLAWVPYSGQKLQNLIWLFRQKTDSNQSASSRLVLDVIMIFLRPIVAMYRHLALK